MEPNKERLRLWVAALRGGKFLQGTGNLKKLHEGVVRYCCLGVACEVAVANGLAVDLSEDRRLHQTSSQVVGEKVFYEFDSRGDALPPSVSEWFGFDDDDPAIGFDDEHGSLLCAIRANDTKKMTFDRIADLVERMYLPEDVKEES